MIIAINGNDYKLPASLADITLNDRIEYDRLYGKDLREKRKQLIETELEDFNIDVVQKTVSFFANIPIDVVEQTAFEDVLVIYDTVLHEFSDDIDFMAPHDLVKEFVWHNELWILSEPQLKQDSPMKFGEFIDAKQSVQNLIDDYWRALLPLCCIYFRKKGEDYDKNFVVEGSKRMELMKTLPLSFAIEAGFFLSCSTSMYPTISRYSGHHVGSLEVNSCGIICKRSDG